MDVALWDCRSCNPRRLVGRERSSSSSCGRRGSLRRRFSDCYRLAESTKGWLQATVIFHWTGRRYCNSWMFHFTASIVSLIPLGNIHVAVCTTFIWVCSLEIIPIDEWQFTAVKHSLQRGTNEEQLANWTLSTFKPYRSNDDELTEWMFQWLELT